MGERTEIKDFLRNANFNILVFCKERAWQIACAVLFFMVLALVGVVYEYFQNVSERKREVPAGAEIIPEASVPSNGAATTVPVTGAVDTIPDNRIRRKIDGVLVDPGKEDLFPFAAMIENHVDSRPPSGLTKAGVVYEAEAEGGITRFLAVYATDEDINDIGPIRSARPYYVDWSREYGALYVHCGGSPDSLNKIINERIFDMNEFYRGSYFWRDKKRSAPHNVYTSSENLKKYIFLQKRAIKNYPPWQFKEDASAEERGTTTQIKIPFIKAPYKVSWTYDKEANAFLRHQGGVKHKDSDGTPVAAKNLIVQYVKQSVYDDYGRQAIATIGKGKSIICIDGICLQGTWMKAGKDSRTKFLYSDGAEPIFTSGTTWIEVIPNWYNVEIK